MQIKPGLITQLPFNLHTVYHKADSRQLLT